MEFPWQKDSQQDLVLEHGWSLSPGVVMPWGAVESHQVWGVCRLVGTDYCFFLSVYACPGFPECKLILWSKVVTLTQKAVGHFFCCVFDGEAGWGMTQDELYLHTFSIPALFEHLFLLWFQLFPDVLYCEAWCVPAVQWPTDLCLVRRYSEELEAVSVSRSLLRNWSSMYKRTGKSATTKVCTDMICHSEVSQQFSNFLYHLWSCGSSGTAECHVSLYSI